MTVTTKPQLRPFTQKLGVRFVGMTHKRGRRNPKTQEFRTQLKDSYRFVRDQAFLDKGNGESVCLDTIDDVAYHLAQKFGEPVFEAVSDVEPGLVISNPNGEGAFKVRALART